MVLVIISINININININNNIINIAIAFVLFCHDRCQSSSHGVSRIIVN